MAILPPSGDTHHTNAPKLIPREFLSSTTSLPYSTRPHNMLQDQRKFDFSDNSSHHLESVILLIHLLCHHVKIFKNAFFSRFLAIALALSCVFTFFSCRSYGTRILRPSQLSAQLRGALKVLLRLPAMTSVGKAPMIRWRC